MIVYSAVFTRGVDRVRKELVDGDSEGSLVVGSFWLCTSELVMLLITGQANGAVGAYNDAGKKIHLPRCQVGLLSFAEAETGVLLADELKSPEYPVWLIHGGDHFTLLFANQHPTPPFVPDAWFELFFWNALPPNRTFQRLKICADSLCPPAPEKLKRKFYKPRPGEIDEIIQGEMFVLSKLSLVTNNVSAIL